MPKRVFGGLLLGLCLIAGNAIAETVYVHDYLRLGVRSHPNSSETPIAVVTTGDALKVLERSNDYLRVRTADGTEGWVSESYVSRDKPARVELERLEKAYAQREAEIKKLREELGASRGQSAESEKKVTLLNNEVEKLQQLTDDYTKRIAELQYEYAWVYQLGGFILLFLLGFLLGVRWYKRRITERLGGMQI